MIEDRVLSDRYRLLGHLARGGMADVYRAEDLLLGRQVAVKILHPQFAGDEAFVERFRREAQAAANLTHPNIVSIFDWGHDGSTYYMVMEMIEGRTLRDVLRSEGALLPKRAAEIVAEAAAAMQAAHQAGVFHRDIKPGNIMLTPDGSVKVTDFGIARALDDSEELTRTGAVIGTATYFSPEQAQGLPADARSDIYSLGVVLYELICGQPPFTGESPVAVAYQHVSEFAPPARQVNPNAPAELEMIAAKAMEKDPAARYQTAADMRADLVAYLQGQPIAAAPVVVATAASGTAATELMGAAGAQPEAATNGGAQYPTEERQGSTAAYVGTIVSLLVILGVGVFILWRLLAPPAATEAAGDVVVIPDLVGTERSEAFETLQGLDLKVRQRDQVSDEVPANLVIATEPPGGSEVDAGSFVTVIVSTGPEQFTLPNVVNDTLESAIDRLEKNGFVVGQLTYAFSDSVDPNVVIRQSPGPGPAAPGTSVDLEVSTGPFALTMPDVTNLTTESALAALAEEGFDDVETIEEFSDEVLEGFVIRTNPVAGQQVPRGNTVQMFVSTGPEPVTVPDLTGQSLQNAQNTIQDLGLIASVGDPTEVTAASGLEGLVAAQAPSAGTELLPGEQVVISLGVLKQVTVPNIIGLPEEEAAAVLADLGLFLQVIGESETEDPDLVGNIATQDPSDGVTLPDGSTVSATIGALPPPTTTTTTADPGEEEPPPDDG